MEFSNGILRVQGPKESLSRKIASSLDMVVGAKEIEIKRKDNSRELRSLHGLTRTLVDNMIKGVTEGFERRLEIIGLGYKAQVQGQSLNLSLGFVEPVKFDLPKGIQAKVEANTKIILTGADKEILGVTAARIRALRLPEPYKGTGIRYDKEVIIRKVGKTATGGAAS